MAFFGGMGVPARAKLLLPQPPIIKRIFYQSRAYRIAQNVLYLSLHIFDFAHCAIKRFLLPDSPFPSEIPVNAMRRGSFDRLHNFRNANQPVFVSQRSEQQMDMVWHYHYGVKFEKLSIPEEASIKNDVSRTRRKHLATV